MLKVLWIAFGGGLGAVLRHGVVSLLQRQPVGDGAWPWGTLTVNVAGCLAIGMLGALFSGLSHAREELRAMLFVGVLGGFTTYSAFGWDTFLLLSKGHFAKALSYALATTVLCLVAVWVGFRLTMRLGLAT